MAEEKKQELEPAKSHELDYLVGSKTPPLTKEMIYKFLDTSYAYHNSNGSMEIDPELEKELKIAFPNLNVREKYQPNNYMWYQNKLNQQVKDQELEFSGETTENSHMLQARMQRAADMMSLVYKVLLKNDISPESAQLISFQAVSKALHKNPNLVLDNELDVQQSNDLAKSLDHGTALKLKPEPQEKEEKAELEKENEGLKYLTEDNGVELQAYLTNQMIRQMSRYHRSKLSETMNNGVGALDLAHDEGSALHASTSLSLKNNIKSLRSQFFPNKTAQPTTTHQKQWQPPTPFDDLDNIKK